MFHVKIHVHVYGLLFSWRGGYFDSLGGSNQYMNEQNKCCSYTGQKLSAVWLCISFVSSVQLLSLVYLATPQSPVSVVTHSTDVQIS